MGKIKYCRAVCKGIIGAVILCLFGFTLLSVIMMKIDVSKSMYNFIYTIIALMSLCMGSIIGAKKNGAKGWLVGAGISLGYYFILFFVAAMSGKGVSFQAAELIKLAGVMFIGTISGIVGVNL